MKILIASNGGWCNTGYGIQTGYWAPRLKSLGHDVEVFAFYGLRGNKIEYDGVTYYPKANQKHGADIIEARVKRLRPDVLITIYDPWVFPSDLGKRIRPTLWIPWMPVDHDPVPGLVLSKIESAYKPVSYSKWGRRMLRDAGVANAGYIPLGVDTSIFNRDIISKKKARDFMDLPQDGFIVGHVGVNKEYPSRKCFDLNMQAFRILLEEEPNAHLYIHSYVGTEKGGLNLVNMAKAYGIEKHVHFPDQYRYVDGFTPKEMACMYRSLDVYLGTTRSEGFGLPIVEAQACGVPAITTEFSSMPELTASGWLVEPVMKIMTMLYSHQSLPSVEGTAKRLIESSKLSKSAYEQVSQSASRFAEDFDCDKLLSKYWEPFLKEIEEDLIWKP